MKNQIISEPDNEHGFLDILLGLNILDLLFLKSVCKKEIIFIIIQASDIGSIENRLIISKFWIYQFDNLTDFWSHSSLIIKSLKNQTILDKSFEHRYIQMVFDLQFLHVHSRPQLLMVSDQNQLLHTTIHARYQMRLHYLRSLLHY